jgi:hypothetical protein
MGRFGIVVEFGHGFLPSCRPTQGRRVAPSPLVQHIQTTSVALGRRWPILDGPAMSFGARWPEPVRRCEQSGESRGLVNRSPVPHWRRRSAPCCRAPTVTADGYLKSIAGARRGSHADGRCRLEYATLARLHLDMPSMQCYQRGAMPDGDDGSVRENFAQTSSSSSSAGVALSRPIRLVENSPRDSHCCRRELLAARLGLRQ